MPSVGVRDKTHVRRDKSADWASSRKKTFHCFIDQLDSISQKIGQFSSSEHADLTKPGKIKLSGPENSNFRRKKDKNQKFDSIPVIFFPRSVFFKNSSIFCSGLKLLNGAKNYLIQIRLMSF